MYDPTVGEFINEDPIGFDAGDANLMRYVGNAPTMATDPSGRWLIGFAESPAVHEFMTFEAALQAGYKYNAGAGPDSAPWLWKLRDPSGDDARYFGAGLLLGCRWPDMPEGKLTDVFDITTRKPKPAEIKRLWDAGKDRLLIESHFGEKQFYHAMTPHESPNGLPLNINAEQLKQKIMDWICQNFTDALKAKKAAKEARAEAEKYKHSGLDLGKLKKRAQVLAKAESLEREAGLALGKAIHTIEDSYSPSHVWRIDGKIHAFQDYSQQDPAKHAQADTWVKLDAIPPRAVGDPVRALPKFANAKIANGYAAGIRAAAQFLRYYLADAEGDAVRTWLDAGVFALEKGAQNGGIPDEDYKKE